MDTNSVPATTPWGYHGYGGHGQTRSKSPEDSEAPIKTPVRQSPTNRKPVRDTESSKRESGITWYSNGQSTQGSLQSQSKEERPGSGLKGNYIIILSYNINISYGFFRDQSSKVNFANKFNQQLNIFQFK